MAKFKPGDPVWTLSRGAHCRAGEHAAVVLDTIHELHPLNYLCVDHGLERAVKLRVEGIHEVLYNHECRVRPRRDDYQQHEARGNNKVIDFIRFASKEDIKVPEEPFEVPVDA